MQGPIERGKKLLPQLHSRHAFQYRQASYGLKQMAWGYFKKLVLADSLSVYVNQVYNDLPSYKGFSLILATFFFAIQLYCDFSGYTDIALGSAKILGINLTQNFKAPYFASSIKDFWGRWHISLSSWLRDYIYIPLGGNRVGKVRHSLNILITFLVSGLWHGASWNYVLWGGLHGVFQIIEGFFPWNSKKTILVKGLVTPSKEISITTFYYALSLFHVPSCLFALHGYFSVLPPSRTHFM